MRSPFDIVTYQQPGGPRLDCCSSGGAGVPGYKDLAMCRSWELPCGLGRVGPGATWEGAIAQREPAYFIHPASSASRLLCARLCNLVGVVLRPRRTGGVHARAVPFGAYRGGSHRTGVGPQRHRRPDTAMAGTTTMVRGRVARPDCHRSGCRCPDRAARRAGSSLRAVRPLVQPAAALCPPSAHR